jgi:hypothetical protein
MRFSVQREALLKPLQQVVGVVERRQTLPVLANVLMVEGDRRASPRPIWKSSCRRGWRSTGRRRRDHGAGAQAVRHRAGLARWQIDLKQEGERVIA